MSTGPTPAFSAPDPGASANLFQQGDAEARRLVSHLHTARPEVYWSDLLLSATLGWGALAISVRERPFSWTMLTAAAVAIFALYRASCFIHEISHLRPRAVPGFETAWNLLVGAPMLMPSVVYRGVHQDHHKLSTYGTSQDPEYLPLAGHPGMIAFFAVESVLLPALLAVRFVVLAPFSLASPPVKRWLAERASSLSINPQYRRQINPGLLRKMALWEAVCLAMWAALLCLAALRVLPWRVFVLWYSVTALGSLINAARTLGAHRYSSAGEPLDREGQLLDSIDTPGALWTGLWAPVGLRYHALHHYFPGIPYHNLGLAYRRLMDGLPDQYSRSTSRSLPRSIGNLCRGSLRAGTFLPGAGTPR